MGKRGRKPFTRSAVEAAFEQHLKAAGKSARTVTFYMRCVHRFLKHIGDTPLNRVTEDTTRAFFAHGQERRWNSTRSRYSERFSSMGFRASTRTSHLPGGNTPPCAGGHG